MNKKVGKILTAAAAGAAVGVAVKKLQDSRKEKEDERIAAIEEAVMNNRDYGDRKAYLVGGGLATLAAAAYLIRDCRFPANQITVYEGMHILGGSNDGIGTPEQGFVCRGGRMLNEETYENFWELFGSIPSLRQPGRSVTEEILEFDHAHPTCAKARLVDKDGNILDVKSMGFNQADRMALLKLLMTDEKKLDNLTIQDWFKETPHIFETNFWYNLGQKVHNLTGIVDGRNTSFSDKLTCDHQIRNTVQSLKNTGQHQRKGIDRQFFSYTSCCQIPLIFPHVLSLLSISYNSPLDSRSSSSSMIPAYCLSSL